ncbi:sensor histidine kinase [Motiliproteus sediminis]|uniref:sensor histidine kinase n=1 Tax=Motiliproteus sediminis TaxID=1468178 RepID=UPI001AEF6C70|nr:ATP-binding protein [Motiliproteus sediminis]
MSRDDLPDLSGPPSADMTPQQLQAAFEQFNALSEQLAATYNELELQVESLQAQLEAMDARREQEVAEKEQASRRLQGLLKLLPAGVVVLDNRGRVQECNPAAEELLGRPLRGEAWLQVIQRAFAPRADDGHEVSLRDGRRVSLATRSLEGEPGQVMLITDQTHTRELQAKVSHYQRLSAMGKMMASLAHQIRTPLSAAMLYSAHLTKPDLTTEQRVRFAAKVKGRLSSLEQQVRDMLIFARGETKLTDLITTQQLFAAIEDALDVPLANADADCDCVNQAPDVWVQCNREALVGALMNLVNNALEAGAESLVVRATLIDDSQLALVVADQGPGLSAEQLAQAQEPFYTTKSQGTGLGLAVAQVVARAHLGEFYMTSESGRGTEAGFRLPYRSPQNAESNDDN